jgi:Hint domain-containing protein
VADSGRDVGRPFIEALKSDFDHGRHDHDDHDYHHHGTPPDCVCFMTGTRIRTPSGEVRVENLKTGDLVLTVNGNAMPVRWVGRQTVSKAFAHDETLPIRIKAGAIDVQVPCEDLLISPRHAIFIDGILIQAGALVNGSTVVREQHVPDRYTYYHIELDDHSLILAENTPSETFIDNVDRESFENWQEYEALYPTGKPLQEMPWPRAKSLRQVPVAIRTRLAMRAAIVFAGNTGTAA